MFFIFVYQRQQFVDGFVFGYVAFDAGFTLVERYSTFACSDVTVVGISHFARTIYDTAHYGDFETDQMCGAFSDSTHGE